MDNLSLQLHRQSIGCSIGCSMGGTVVNHRQSIGCSMGGTVVNHRQSIGCSMGGTVVNHRQSIGCSIGCSMGGTSVVTIPDFAMRYVSRYLGHDAIRIAILVYRVSQSLDLQLVYDGSAIYRPRYTLPNHHNRCRMCWSLAVA